MITVDYRESGLLEILKDAATSSNLIHGDVMISVLDDSASSEDDTAEYVTVNEDKTPKPPSKFFIIERKTLADLSSSIKDSRFREQKSRLLSVYPPERIIYIIENCRKSKHNLSDKILRSAIINLSLKHRITVIHSKDIQETAEIIKSIEEKLSINEFDALNYNV